MLLWWKGMMVLGVFVGGCSSDVISRGGGREGQSSMSGCGSDAGCWLSAGQQWQTTDTPWSRRASRFSPLIPLHLLVVSVCLCVCVRGSRVCPWL